MAFCHFQVDRRDGGIGGGLRKRALLLFPFQMMLVFEIVGHDDPLLQAGAKPALCRHLARGTIGDDFVL